MFLLTKQKRNAWYKEASHAYREGYQSACQKDYIGTEIADSVSAEICFRRGHEDGSKGIPVKTTWPEIYKLPIDLWSEVLARKLQPSNRDLNG